jgi:hypothetical protein
MRVLILAIAAFSIPSIPVFACSPVPGAHINTFAENFRAARSVFLGTVTGNVEKGGVHRLEFRVDRRWKGEGGATEEATGVSNTCSGFGQAAEVGAVCVVFVDSRGEAISGVNSGEASACVPEGSPRSKVLGAEYEKKVGDLIRRDRK